MYERSIRDEFTHQTETFARSPAMTSATALGTIVDLVPEHPGARWLEVACGPAAVGRTLSRRVGSVHGVDLTPAMIEKARQRRVLARRRHRAGVRGRQLRRRRPQRRRAPRASACSARALSGAWRCGSR
jgi:tRNA/tmRNA/rRNA uracil-C5-methylase (TrmA/RlmC/RlmD family)